VEAMERDDVRRYLRALAALTGWDDDAILADVRATVESIAAVRNGSAAEPWRRLLGAIEQERAACASR